MSSENCSGVQKGCALGFLVGPCKTTHLSYTDEVVLQSNNYLGMQGPFETVYRHATAVDVCMIIIETQRLFSLSPKLA